MIFYWAPGSHWERNTLASFGFTIGHVIGEHRWMDTMFPDFFEKHGGVYGVNVKDRLTEIDPKSPVPWVEFLAHIGGSTSPYYRYLFHQESVVDPEAEEIHFLGGQGVAFTYSFERYYHELREVLTDCRAVDFFRMYDLFGPGFASTGNWAGQNPPEKPLREIAYAKRGHKPTTREKYDPNPSSVAVPNGIPEEESMERGKEIYLAQCTPCHGVQGDGKGFLAAGFTVKPRDFRQGVYKFRSTESGEFPTMEDIEHIVRVGVPGTTMPAWGQFLTAEQIGDVSRYLVVFSEDFALAWKNGEKATPFTISDPPGSNASLLARGKSVYKKAQCAACHGEGGRGDGTSAPGLKDNWGEPIAVGDLTNKWNFRNGHNPRDVYRTFVGGLLGTPMPSYGASLADETDRWALVAYVLSLSPAARPVIRLADFARERLTRIRATDGRVMPKVGK